MSISKQSVRAFAAVTTALALAAVAPLAEASTAAAATRSSVALTGASSMVADSVHQHVFISDTSANTIQVVDFSGNPVTTIGGLAGASSMALSDDSGILYVALSGSNAIAAINTATLQEAALYFTAGQTPEHVAVVGDHVAFSYGSPGSAGIGVLDPATLTINLAHEGVFYDAPILASSPSAPGVLVAGNAGLSPSQIEAFDVSSGAPVSTATSDPWSQSDGCENLGQLALAANGTDVITACGWPYYGSSLNLKTMTEDAKYNTGPYPNSVAVAPNGEIAIGVDATSSSVYLFTPGDSAPVATDTLGGFGVDDLAWSANGSKLFAITASASHTDPTLNIITTSG